jgi:hypothetical protein
MTIGIIQKTSRMTGMNGGLGIYTLLEQINFFVHGSSKRNKDVTSAAAIVS